MPYRIKGSKSINPGPDNKGLLVVVDVKPLKIKKMKKIIFVLTVMLVAFISCEKESEVHIMVYDMQELTLGEETKLIETKVIGFRTLEDNTQAYIDKYQVEPQSIIVDGWTGTQWVEVRVYPAAPQ